jgi:hypothetical protein
MTLPKYLLQDGHRQLRKENIRTEITKAKAIPRTISGGSPKMPVELCSTERRAMNANTNGPIAII